MAVSKEEEGHQFSTEPRSLFDWQRHPEAESLILHIVDQCCQANLWIENLRKDLLLQTSTRLFDWIDHVAVGYCSSIEKKLVEVGFLEDSAAPSYRVFRHPGAQLPLVVLKDHVTSFSGIALNVDNIVNFLMVRGMSGVIEGTPYGSYRRCSVNVDNEVILWVVERRGTRGMEPVFHDESYLKRFIEAKEKWKTRPRSLSDEEEAIERTLKIAAELVSLVGQEIAAWIVLECEREYWQARNMAAQVQKNRQDRLGMGWANHDHHTFRSSRRHFASLVRLFEILGFHCRERFYAGLDAGWGAQVMEHQTTRLVLFLDVDLDAKELEIDFAHHELPELPVLGTVGLWCELHGDSILKAGMHHLEAQFMFDELQEDLAQMGVGMMNPFSDFSYLRQAFTKGEIWKVDPLRLQKLVDRRLVTPDQASKFAEQGAIGSHMENLQRREGYKGFNQKNVSFIIRKTDPRTIESVKGA